MVGIYKKVKQILNMIRTYAPILNKIAPGIAPLILPLTSVTETIADGVNNVYEDYGAAKKKSEKYGFFDGVKSFLDPERVTSLALPPSTDTAMKSLTKSYGGIHPRLNLKGY